MLEADAAEADAIASAAAARMSFEDFTRGEV